MSLGYTQIISLSLISLKFLLHYIRMPLAQQKKARVDTLSRILGISRSSQINKSSSPDIDLIRNLKERVYTDNPLMRLCIEDYELMCSNKMVFNMMVKVLDTDKKQLKKICKNIHILKENINSSPESIKNKMKEYKTPILKLPEELRENIVNIFEELLKYELRDWIPIEKLDWGKLSLNINAVKLLDENPNNIDWRNLPGNRNPYAIDLIKKYAIDNKELEDNIDWEILSCNPNAIDLLETQIKKDIDSISWYLLAENPEAIGILKKYREKIIWNVISSNPNAIDLLKEKWGEEKYLMKTNRPQYNQLKDFENIVAWNVLSGNKGAIDLLREKINKESLLSQEEYELLEYNEKIAWVNLSENPEAIDLLEKNKDKIVWSYLSSNTNPKAMKLLKERIEYEKSLSIKEYRALSNKINWSYLSNNKNATKILEENIDKIVWSALSNNLVAIHLLEAYQKKIDWVVLSGNPNAMNLLEANQDKINWSSLSRNPNAMNLLEANQDKINWDELSSNPSIFILK